MYQFVHEITLQVIGTLPLELEFVYGFCDIFLFIVIVICAISPLIFLFKVLS